jgi:hypothetical protein
MAKSLPSRIMRLKYSPRQLQQQQQKQKHEMFNVYSTLRPKYNQIRGDEDELSDKGKSAYLRRLKEAIKLIGNYLSNMTQLDFVLIAIFLMLLCIMIICITSFVIYKRSYKKLDSKKEAKNGKNSILKLNSFF